MKIVFSRDAEDDLDAIAAYTYEEWGEEQAVLYVTQLRDACESLPRQKRYARVVLQRPDLRRIRCERHVIYFRDDAIELEVVRILHEKMLPENHL